jgi:hypothetical protein
LAPFADLSASANISGNIIVGQLGTPSNASTAELHADYFSGTGQPSMSATPEPLTFGLVGSGLLAIGFLGRRFRKK